MRRTLLSLVVFAALWLTATAPSAAAADFKLVVNAANPVTTLSVSLVQRLFLRKDTRWQSGDAVEPIDQSPKQAVRESFTRQVHGKDVGAVKSYWQMQVFSGRATPPPEVVSDADVLAFVRTHPGAIGYVSSTASTGDGVNVVKLSQ